MRSTYIDWNVVADDEFEDLVAALMAETDPSARAIEGAGGDGGRDIETGPGGRLDWFDAKCFRGRIGSVQRKQVKRALNQALKSAPKSWTLVVPTKLTDLEWKWFDGLDHPSTTELRLLDRVWLETELSKRPHLVRAYLHTFNEQLLENIARYQAESAQLGRGLPDAVERFQALQELTNTVDPDFRFQVRTSDERTEVDIIPRTAMAADGLRLDFSLLGRSMRTQDPQLADRLQDALDFGGDVTVPAEFVSSARLTLPARLGFDAAEPGQVAFSISPVEEDQNFSAAGWLQIDSAHRRKLARLPVSFNRRTRGRLGVRMFAQDVSGTLALKLEVGHASVEPGIELSIAGVGGRQPAEVVDVIKFLNLVRRPHRMSIWIDGRVLGRAAVADYQDGGITPTDQQVDALVALDLINQVYDLRLAIPQEIPSADWNILLAMGRLIEDGSANLPIFLNQVPLDASGAARVIESLDASESGLFGLETEIAMIIPFQRDDQVVMRANARFVGELDTNVMDVTDFHQSLTRCVDDGATFGVPLRPHGRNPCIAAWIPPDDLEPSNIPS